MSDETQAPERFRVYCAEYIRHDRPALAASPIVQEIVREERERAITAAHHALLDAVPVFDDAHRYAAKIADAIRKEDT